MLPTDFLKIARELLNAYPIAASYRSAVSRAYYAAFHHAKEFIEGAGITILASGEGHRDVSNHLSEIGDDDLAAVGSELSGFRGDRNEADYRLSTRRLESRENASLLVSVATDLIARIEMCRKNSSRYENFKSKIKDRNRFLRGLTPPGPSPQIG